MGEVLGVAGVDGNGQRALAEAISGQRRLSHGEIRYLGAPVGKLSVGQREKLGLRYVTDDRLGEGIVSALPVSLNLVLKRIGRAPYWRHGRMHPDAIDKEAERLIRRFDIRTPSAQARAGTLSGGNIQKLLLARELSFDAKVVVFHKPTYGLDLKTTRVVREMIGDLRKDGAALVISTDLDELLELSDRIAVLSRGRIVGVVKNGPGAAEQVGRLMIGDVTLGVQDTPEPAVQRA
jgi:simple sugar transport system ATP-binding protein